MINAIPICDLDSSDFGKDEIAIHGLLLGKGNFATGGEAWIVSDWDHRDDETMKIKLGPPNVFEILLENLDAFGGGEFVLYYKVSAKGKLEDNPKCLLVEELVAQIDDDDDVSISFT